MNKFIISISIAIMVLFAFIAALAAKYTPLDFFEALTMLMLGALAYTIADRGME